MDAVRRAETKVWLGFWALAVSDRVLQEEQRDRYRGFRSQLVDHLSGIGLLAEDARMATDHLMTSVDGVAVSAMFDREHWSPARQRGHIREVVGTLPALAERRRTTALGLGFHTTA